MGVSGLAGQAGILPVPRGAVPLFRQASTGARKGPPAR